MKNIVSVLAVLLALACAAVPACAKNAGAAGTPASGELRKIDTVVGSGRLAMAGSTVSINYTGWLYSPQAARQRGVGFDQSKPGAPLTFKIGGGSVIKGWEEGMRGMKVGGKRTLVIPSALGFGEQGLGPVPPKANLIFDIELVDVK